MTYVFASRNTSAVFTLSADTEKEAWELLKEFIIPEMNDFRLEEIEKD